MYQVSKYQPITSILTYNGLKFSMHTQLSFFLPFFDLRDMTYDTGGKVNSFAAQVLAGEPAEVQE